MWFAPCASAMNVEGRGCGGYSGHLLAATAFGPLTTRCARRVAVCVKWVKGARGGGDLWAGLAGGGAPGGVVANGDALTAGGSGLAVRGDALLEADLSTDGGARPRILHSLPFRFKGDLPAEPEAPFMAA